MDRSSLFSIFLYFSLNFSSTDHRVFDRPKRSAVLSLPARLTQDMNTYECIVEDVCNAVVIDRSSSR